MLEVIDKMQEMVHNKNTKNVICAVHFRKYA